MDKMNGAAASAPLIGFDQDGSSRMSQQGLDVLCAVARKAGDEIMAVYKTEFSATAKDDASPLTEADLRADAAIRSGLEAAFPGVFILSEESVSAQHSGSSAFFLVDPLDGTKEFIKRNGEFTVNIAFVVDGVPVAGVVLAPALDEMFFAGQGLGAWKQSAAGTVALQAPVYEGGRLRVMGSRSHGADKTTHWLNSLPVESEFVAAGSSLKFCRIAEASADIYPRFGPTSQWDTAAAQCVLECAGGSVTTLAGVPLRYGLEREILNPEFFATGVFAATWPLWQTS